MQTLRAICWTWALVVTLPLAAGCGARRADAHLGGESHFLSACGSECASDFECIGQVCTLPCSNDSICQDVAVGASCVVADDNGSCDYNCEQGTSDCAPLGDNFVCQHGKCRPTLTAPEPALSCTESGRSYADGETWTCASGCNSCWCDAGQLGMTVLPCEPGSGCDEDGVHYNVGEDWPCADGCNTCFCSENGISSTDIACVDETTCEYDGVTYQHNVSWPCSDGCNTCTCSQGSVVQTDVACMVEECDPTGGPDGILTCPANCGNCTCADGTVVAGGVECPTGGEADCILGDVTYQHGESWDCDCNSCWCDNGMLVSTAVECGPAPTRCEDGGEPHAIGDVWKCSDGCNRCSCSEAGEVTIQLLASCADGGAGICTLPLLNDGDCLGAFPSYYFDSDTGRCEAFVYFGCGGNDNRFDTQAECERWCGVNPTVDAG